MIANFDTQRNFIQGGGGWKGGGGGEHRLPFELRGGSWGDAKIGFTNSSKFPGLWLPNRGGKRIST